MGLGYDPGEAERCSTRLGVPPVASRSRGSDRGGAAHRGAGRMTESAAEISVQVPGVRAGEEELDRSLRPQRLDEFVGQEQLKGQLGLFIEAARRRGEPLDHVLLAGPPGLGKTSLAHITARELDVPLVQTAGPALERKGDVAAFLTALEPGSVFFIDEIHRLTRAVEETLYPAMEDRRLPIVLGQGAGARTVTLDLPPFTLVGATTRTGLLTTPLRERFGVCHRLEHYPVRRPGADRAALGPHPRRRDRRRRRARRSPRGRAARRAWRTGCCGACATSPRCARR